MKIARSSIPLVIALIVGIVLGLAISFGWRGYDRPTYRESESPLVEKAYRVWSHNGRASRVEFNREFSPVVVYLPEMTCVGLNLKPSLVGGDETICFDERGRIVRYYVNGD